MRFYSINFDRRRLLNNILPEWLYRCIKERYVLDEIQEIRIRKNQPILLCYKGKYIEIHSESGLYLKPIMANQELIEYILSIATKKSLYAFDDQIKKGFIIADNGIRIGLCGTAVTKNDEVTFIKNITSLNIRIGHQISDCARSVIRYLVANDVIKNTLIVSAPGAGKTTMIRDIVYKLSNEFSVSNILVIDERFELAGQCAKFNLGQNVDIMQGANKNFAFHEAIKVMNPNVIVADELSSSDDIEGIKFAIKSGVSVIATIHAGNIDDLKSKPYFQDVLKDKYFERIILLSKRNGVGTIEGVFDENLFALFIPSIL